MGKARSALSCLSAGARWAARQCGSSAKPAAVTEPQWEVGAVDGRRYPARCARKSVRRPHGTAVSQRNRTNNAIALARVHRREFAQKSPAAAYSLRIASAWMLGRPPYDFGVIDSVDESRPADAAGVRLRSCCKASPIRTLTSQWGALSSRNLSGLATDPRPGWWWCRIWRSSTYLGDFAQLLAALGHRDGDRAPQRVFGILQVHRGLQRKSTSPCRDTLSARSGG